MQEMDVVSGQQHSSTQAPYTADNFHPLRWPNQNETEDDVSALSAHEVNSARKHSSQNYSNCTLLQILSDVCTLFCKAGCEKYLHEEISRDLIGQMEGFIKTGNLLHTSVW